MLIILVIAKLVNLSFIGRLLAKEKLTVNIIIFSFALFLFAELPLYAEIIEFKDLPTETVKVNLKNIYYDNPYQNEQYPPIKLEASLHEPLLVNLEEVLAQALENNLNLLRAKQDTLMAKWEFYKKLSEVLPDLNYSLQGRTLDGTFFLNSQFQRNIDEKQAQSILRINYRAFNGGTTSFLAWAEKHYKNAAKEDEKLQFNKVLLDSVVFYNKLIVQQVSLMSKLDSVKESKSDLELAEKYLGAGTGTQYDVYLAEARLASSQQELIEQEAGFREAEIDLAEHLRMPLSSPLKIAEEDINKFNLVDEAITVEEFIATAKEKNPRIRSALLKRKGAYKEALSKIGDFLPNLDLFADFTATGASVSDLNNITSLGFLVSFDLGQGLGTTPAAELMRAKASAKRAKLLYEQEEIRIEKDLRKAFLGFEKAKALVNASRRGYTAAKEGMRLSRLRYENGLGLFNDVVQRQKELSEAIINLINSIGAYNNSQAQLSYEMGTISIDSILAKN